MDLWFLKQPLYQLSHSHCPNTLFYCSPRYLPNYESVVRPHNKNQKKNPTLSSFRAPQSHSTTQGSWAIDSNLFHGWSVGWLMFKSCIISRCFKFAVGVAAVPYSRARQNQCDQIWRNFATLAKFCKSLGNFEKLKLVFGNFVNLLGQIDKLLGKFPLLWMAQYWKIIYPSGHTDGKPLTLMRTWK